MSKTNAKNRPRLALAVQYACDHPDMPARAQLRRWVAAAQEGPLIATLRFVTLDEARTLNRDYRGKDYATNVLTFVYEAAPATGDVVICPAVVAQEAAAQGKTFKAHLAHMVVHGMLHLQGYDHEAGRAEAAAMEAREREILARFRIADPYR